MKINVRKSKYGFSTSFVAKEKMKKTSLAMLMLVLEKTRTTIKRRRNASCLSKMDFEWL